MTRAILVDTDPGLDDAIALLLVLSDPAFDLRGITTVAGNLGLDVTTANAGRLLALVGRPEVPLHAGADRPPGRPPRDEARIHGTDGLGGISLPRPVPPGAMDAVTFLARTLDAAPPGTIELHCLGPLTNLAHLLDAAPTSAMRLARVIAMGGALETHGNAGPRSEFNLAQDPEAAARVLSAGLDLTLVPLDTTRQVRADAPFLARLDAGPLSARTAAALLRAYFATATDRTSRPLHDPLVPLLAVHPDLFTTERHHLDIDLSDDPGALIPGPYPVELALAPDAPRLLDRLAQGLSASRATSTQKRTPAGIARSSKS